MTNIEQLKTKVFESLGAASMCWSETPKGVFDDALALEIGNELWAEIAAFIAGSKAMEGHFIKPENKDRSDETFEKLKTCPNYKWNPDE